MIPLRESRIIKALTDHPNGLLFDEALARLKGIRALIVCDSAAANSPAGQAAMLTAAATAKKTFGEVRVIADPNVPLFACGPLGNRIGDALTRIGVPLSADIEATHVITIGDTPPCGAWYRRCWWNGWHAGLDSDARLGDGMNPLAGVYSGALATAAIFRTVGTEAVLRFRPMCTSLWEPHLEVRDADIGPKAVDVPNNVWIVGLGHVGQAYAWALTFLPYSGRRRAHLQDFDLLAEENEGTSLAFWNEVPFGERKTRLVSRWLECAGWKTTLIERPFNAPPLFEIDDPRIALVGLDKVPPRKLVATAGFEHVVDGGTGGGATEYECFQVRTFRNGDSVEAAWNPERPKAREATLAMPAYAELLSTADARTRCGLVEIADASVALPFVGAAVAAIAVSQAIRLASGRRCARLLTSDLALPGMPMSSGTTDPAETNFGSEPMRF
ncbi:hypothetical protein [Roseiterribacter gracilis]|uniref:THIF-type NAD/FAD binding fold domain-containing protein n=1 Tax=Roseiterribacter gracilis TaxID=2812848 RepID=A0A8S8XHA1_9PROT|nr:hypothetical protein TMPK1_27920 [Rhodospirillales bacterium TMPK1]